VLKTLQMFAADDEDARSRCSRLIMTILAKTLAVVKENTLTVSSALIANALSRLDCTLSPTAQCVVYGNGEQQDNSETTSHAHHIVQAKNVPHDGS
jgi:hypothetical protein